MSVLARKNNFFDLTSNIFDVFSDDYKKWSNFPKINTSEDVDNFKVDVFFPGGKRDNFKIKVENKTLLIKYEQSDEDSSDVENYHFREFSHKSFVRKFVLPDEVVKNKINASYEDGVLKVNIPKDKVKEKEKTFEVKID